MRCPQALLCVLASAGLVFGSASLACAQTEYSPNLTGILGLNTIPSARMDETGTVRLGVSTMDPYAHGFIGFQLAEPLYVNIRQSAEVSNINADPDRLYPGVDFKLRLLEENRSRPEIAIGLQSAIGHKRMAGEYITLSKRYENFDFTAGMGWGRYGSAGHMDNPLKSLSSHFGKNRALDGEMPNKPADWFKGNQVGFFGGIEYFTPLEGLSLKADWGGDRYEAEQTAFNYDPPSPWSFGLNYQPFEWMNLSVAMQGLDKIMGRLSLQGLLSDLRQPRPDMEKTRPMRPYRTELNLPEEMKLSALREGLILHDTGSGLHSARTRLVLQPHSSTPHQLGRTAVHMSNHGGPALEEMHITPTVMGLQGPSVRLIRRDFEQALAHDQGSAQEIWHNAEFSNGEGFSLRKLPRLRESSLGLRDYRLVLDGQLSLAEEDSGTLYRTAIVAGSRGPRFFGLIDTGAAFRVNIKDNLNRLTDIRPRAILPVRSNVDQFTARTIALEEMYAAFTHSFRSDLHMSVIGGYLEEMYGGAGGEILYRPYGSRFALGAESWLAFKRDPFQELSMGFNGDHLLTGHVNVWYDVPGMGVTLKGSVGRYLAEDIGGTLAVQKSFKNGADLEGFISVTDRADFDLFGGTTHVYHGIRLNMPLGGYKYVPDGVFARFTAAPFGRDSGQKLRPPLTLHALTQPFSAPHMIRHWDDVTPENP